MRRLCLLFLVGCSGGPPTDSSDPYATLPAGCDDGAPLDEYVFGLERRSTNDRFTVRLTDAVPTPPDVGDNLLGFELEGSDGLVSEGVVTFRPFMPLHGHGTSPEFYDASPEGGGWSVGPMDLFMPGLWELTVAIDAGGEADEALLRFCLRG